MKQQRKSMKSKAGAFKKYKKTAKTLQANREREKKARYKLTAMKTDIS